MSKLQFTVKARQARWIHDGRDELGPQYYNAQTIKVFAINQEDALRKAEEVYGHKRSTDPEADPWVEMGITEVEEV